MAIVSLLAQVADSKASQAANAVSSIMPSGVILPYGGNTAPTGWLECNGQEISQATYAELFAALGTTYNTQLNPVTGANWAVPSVGNFRVPDMRGMFMRGEGTPSGLDAVTVGDNQVQKTKPNALAIGASTAAAQTLSASSVSVSGAKNQMNGATGGMSANSTLSHSYSASDGSPASNIPVNYFYISGAIGQIAGQGLAPGTVNNHNVSHTHGWDFGAASFSANGSLTSLTLNSSSVAAPTISGDNETRPINRGVKYIIKV